MPNKSGTVVVTGGAGGIGKAIVSLFSRSGYEVIIADINESGATSLIAGLNSPGENVLFIQTDVSDPASIEDLMEEAAFKSGRIDVLINNAGFGITKPAEELTVDEWDSVINTNLRGAFLCSREALPFMKDRGGLIINIASTRALMSEPDSEAYAASKGGLISLTHSMAASFATYRIRVNCISPGWIETGDYLRLREADHLQHFSGRVGRPEDIASTCLFLVENDFINGENIIVDGGMTRKMIYEP